MKYTLIRLLLFIVTVGAISIGSVLYTYSPGMEILIWFLSPIFAALIAWAFRATIDAQVQERVDEILKSTSAEQDDDSNSKE